MNDGINVSSGSIGIEQMREIISRMSGFALNFRDYVTDPKKQKTAPTISVVKQAALLERSESFVYKALRESPETVPQGTASTNGSRRFTLEENLIWQSLFSTLPQRPDGVPGTVLAVSALKGGCGKTFTSVTLAQRFAMAGRKTLLIDCDPQGSSTSSMTIVPETDVLSHETLNAVFFDPEHPHYAPDARVLVRESYWPGLSIIPANLSLFLSELMIARSLEEDEDAVSVLKKALEPLKEVFDVIIIDSAPTMSPLNLNITKAADGLLVPLVPDMLSFLSNCSYWKLFEEIIDSVDGQDEILFDFIKVWPMMTKTADISNPEGRKMKLHEDLVQGWSAQMFPSNIYCPEIAIPSVNIVKDGFMDFKTPYDLDPRDVDRKQLNKILEPLERFYKFVDNLVCESWQKRSQNINREAA